MSFGIASVSNPAALSRISVRREFRRFAEHGACQATRRWARRRYHWALPDPESRAPLQRTHARASTRRIVEEQVLKILQMRRTAAGGDQYTFKCD